MLNSAHVEQHQGGKGGSKFHSLGQGLVVLCVLSIFVFMVVILFGLLYLERINIWINQAQLSIPCLHLLHLPLLLNPLTITFYIYKFPLYICRSYFIFYICFYSFFHVLAEVTTVTSTPRNLPFSETMKGIEGQQKKK